MNRTCGMTSPTRRSNRSSVRFTMLQWLFSITGSSHGVCSRHLGILRSARQEFASNQLAPCIMLGSGNVARTRHRSLLDVDSAAAVIDERVLGTEQLSTQDKLRLSDSVTSHVSDTTLDSRLLLDRTGCEKSPTVCCSCFGLNGELSRSQQSWVQDRRAWR